MATTVWRGYITFGLISIPVRLFRAARAERVKLKQMYRLPSRERASPGEDDDPSAFRAFRDGRAPAQNPAAADDEPVEDSAIEEAVAPVRHVAVADMTDDVIPRASLTKGYEFEKNRFVAIDAEELKSIEPKTATEMEILEFVRLSEIDPIYLEASYYVRPEGAGERPYALLYKSLQLTGLVAIARFAMHRREHIVVLRPGKSGIVSHTMYFASEVRSDQEYRTDADLVSKKDLALSEALIHNLASEFTPEKYKDTYREKLEAMIEAKLQGRQTGSRAVNSSQAPVVDLTEALRKSLSLVKKPPASAKRASAPTPISSARKNSSKARAQQR